VICINASSNVRIVTKSLNFAPERPRGAEIDLR
jgi:hypothetical protein